MPVSFRDVARLNEAIHQQCPSPAVIGIDGWMDSGKSTLARALASRYNASSYDLDCALTPGLDCYVDAIQLAKVSQSLQGLEGLVFVSGVCIRTILALIGCDAAAHVYVKRMAAWGWADEDQLSGDPSSEISGVSEPWLEKEVRCYHQLWRPHLVADFEYLRFE